MKYLRSFWNSFVTAFGLIEEMRSVVRGWKTLSSKISGIITNSRHFCVSRIPGTSLAPLGFTEMVAPNAHTLYSVERFVLRGDLCKVISSIRERSPSLLVTFNFKFGHLSVLCFQFVMAFQLPWHTIHLIAGICHCCNGIMKQRYKRRHPHYER